MNAISLAAALPEERRRSDRLSLERVGTVRFGNQPPAQVVVSNLTRDGCRLKTGLALPANAEVTIDLVGIGPVTMRVVWHGPAGYGCTFAEPLARGSVTAAADPRSVTALRSDRCSPCHAAKWPRRSALTLVASATVAAWLAIGGVALLLVG